jgi:general secretion pathway protein F
MPSYEYRGFDAQGRSRKGVTSAISPKEARERLAQEGVLAEALAPIGRKTRFPADLRAVAYRELGALIKAGMPLDQALALLAASPEADATRPLLAGIRDRILEGESLARAFRSAAKACPPFEFAILEAAERSAQTDTMLIQLADFIESREKLRSGVVSALIYPILVLTLGFCSAIVLLGVLVPRMHASLLSGNVTLPGITRLALTLGAGLTHWITLIVAAMLVGAAAWRIRHIRRDPALRRNWDRRLFAFPLYGRGYTLLANLRFADTLAVLISGGVALVEAMEMAGRATGSPWIAHLAQEQADRMRHGESLSRAVRAVPPLAATLPGWIQIGEAGGGLAAILSGAAQRYRDLWTRYVDRRLRLLEPLVILGMGAFVLFITLAILLPIFSLGDML